MVRKYILDSLAFWLDAYRVDGFRFDLLGTHDPATVRAACELVRARRPDATLYGEPWTGGGPIRFGKGAQKGMSIAVFNDHLRNAIRGDLDGTASGFATGPEETATRSGAASRARSMTSRRSRPRPSTTRPRTTTSRSWTRSRRPRLPPMPPRAGRCRSSHLAWCS
jgi:pullulanase/glycogen debranching enzyme